MKITVLGAGAWGTALARLLQTNESQVTLWGHCAEHLRTINRVGLLEADLEKAVAGAELIVLAVPSKAFREVASRLGGLAATLVSVTKGIEYATGLPMSGILEQTCP